MPLDPVIIALAERMPEFLTYRIWERTPQEARDLYRKFSEASEPHDITIGKSESLEAPGPTRPIVLRAYTPVAAGSASLPAIVYFHGGGFVMGDLETHDALCRTMTNTSGCRVFS